MRRREWIEGRTLEETTQNTKEERLANHHAQDAFGIVLITKTATNLPMGAITPQTHKKTRVLMAQELTHSETHALEGSRLKPAGEGAAGLAIRENNDLIYKSEV